MGLFLIYGIQMSLENKAWVFLLKYYDPVNVNLIPLSKTNVKSGNESILLHN